MIALPLVIHHEILKYVAAEDCIQYTLLNKSIFVEIAKESRRLFIKKESARDFFTTQSFRESLLDKIKNPYHQLHLDLTEGFEEIEPNLSGFPWQVSVFSLTISPATIELLLPRFSLIQTLNLYNNWSFHGGVDKDYSVLFDVVSKRCEVKELLLEHFSFLEPPLFPSVQVLELSSCHDITSIDLFHLIGFMNLRVLKLRYCSSLIDVSCLSHIFELHLLDCPTIRDISDLNNNHKIVIENCGSIRDYSKSFRYSKVIVLQMSVSSHHPLYFNQLQAVTSLALKRMYPQLVSPLLYSESFPPTLRSLSICSFPEFRLPKQHQLKELIIESTSVISLESLDENTTIQSITLNNCKEISNFTPLLHVRHVNILDCPCFTGYSSFPPDFNYQMKTLHVSLLNFTNMQTWKHIDVLSYFFSSHKISSNFVFLLLTSQLKEFELKLYDYPPIEGANGSDILLHLITSKEIEKITIVLTSRDPEDFEKILLKIIFLSENRRDINVIPSLFKIILLKQRIESLKTNNTLVYLKDFFAGKLFLK